MQGTAPLAPLTPSIQVLGWVSLIAVAGVSFYFAKQNINERRRQQDIAGERPSTKLDCKPPRLVDVSHSYTSRG